MKMRTLLLTGAILAGTTGMVFAQSGNMTTPPDQSGASQNSNSMMNSPTSGSASGQTMQKNKSPASPGASIKQEK